MTLALRQSRDALKDTRELKKTLEQRGLNPISADSRERLEERRVLGKAARSRANASDAEAAGQAETERNPNIRPRLFFRFRYKV